MLLKNQWGPSAWHFLHAIAFKYPEQPSPTERAAAKKFFESLGHLLPCKSCNEHYLEFLKGHPVAVGSRKALARWVHRLHNRVNSKNGKATVPYDAVHAMYHRRPGLPVVGTVLIVLVLVVFLSAHFS